MSLAKEIAGRVTTPAEAAQAIRETMVRVTPDLVEPSIQWKRQARLMAGAVGVCMGDLGKARKSSHFADATMGELRCSQAGDGV